jgi:type I site-specific restriction-modification system R (restriction) subunit
MTWQDTIKKQQLDETLLNRNLLKILGDMENKLVKDSSAIYEFLLEKIFPNDRDNKTYRELEDMIENLRFDTLDLLEKKMKEYISELVDIIESE